METPGGAPTARPSGGRPRTFAIVAVAKVVVDGRALQIRQLSIHHALKHMLLVCLAALRGNACGLKKRGRD